MKADRLVEIFMEMLFQIHDLEETAPSLIRRAAGAYALELMQHGEIPFNFVDDVLTDLEAEVTEMYRKKTYGFITLRAFRDARVLRKNPRRKTSADR